MHGAQYIMLHNCITVHGAEYITLHNCITVHGAQYIMPFFEIYLNVSFIRFVGILLVESTEIVLYKLSYTNDIFF